MITAANLSEVGGFFLEVDTNSLLCLTTAGISSPYMQTSEPPAISWIVIILMLIMTGGFITLVVAIIRDFHKYRMQKAWIRATKFERREITEYATHQRLDVLVVRPSNTAQLQTLAQYLRRHTNPLELIQEWEKYRTKQLAQP
jgi:hypothetical protein